MGAATFVTTATGKDAQSAFRDAVSNAQYQHGHSGYTGTIAEKHSWVMILDRIPDILPRIEAAENLSDDGKRIHAKWLTDAQATGKPLKIAGAIAQALLGIDDARTTSKNGPAGCIHVEGQTYLFFGWARE